MVECLVTIIRTSSECEHDVADETANDATLAIDL